MAKHRRRSRTPSAAFELPADELTAISAELQRRKPSAPSDKVDAAVRDAVDVLSGLDTAPHHVPALVSRRAEAALDDFHRRQAVPVQRHSARSGSRVGA
jgi:hypothetical protein